MSTATTGRHSLRYGRFADAFTGAREKRRRAAGWEPKHRRLSIQEFGTAFMKSFKAMTGASALVQRDLTRAR
jgi:hypothetical protein